jgi:hypothetical protein
MLVQLERATTSADIPDADATVLILNLEISNMKDGECDVFQFS